MSAGEPTGSEVGVPAQGPPADVRTTLLTYEADVLDFLRRRVPAALRALIEAEDVWQEVCIESFQRYDQFRGHAGDDARRLLLTIARNRLVDLVRHHGAAKRGGLCERVGDERGDGDGGTRLIPLLEQLAVYERTPSRSAIAHEDAAHLQRTLKRLPDDYALCVRLRHIEQRSVAETARLMKRTEGAIHKMCARALDLLRTELLRSLAHP